MSVLLIFVVALLYGVLHSLLASHPVRQFFERILGRWYRLFYNAVAGVTLLPLLVMVPLLPNRVLYSVPSPWRWGMVAIQLLAALLAADSIRQTDALRFLGLRQLFQADMLPSNHLKVTGFYILVRHPVYFFSLVFLWFSPIMSQNQLALYATFSFYLFVGTIFEERKLADQFGATYRAYQREVPMLFPWKPSLWGKWRAGEEFLSYLEERAA